MVNTKRHAMPQARDIMTEEILTVATTTSITDLEQLLSDRRITGVPVTNERGHIIGVVSLRDLLDRYADDTPAMPRGSFYDLPTDAANLDEDFGRFEVPIENTDTVGDVMTGQVFSVDVSTPLPEIAKRMLDLKIHRLLVTENGSHVGLITTFDLLTAVAGLPLPRDSA